ncbi:hypothetical protein [Alistipes putredinis]|uniref:hypothetical protein n=1 Tax=Alistipes putredinis TaxID=28117 RepID=UPI003AF18B79
MGAFSRAGFSQKQDGPAFAFDGRGMYRNGFGGDGDAEHDPKPEAHQGLMGFASVSEQVALYIRRIERFEEERRTIPVAGNHAEQVTSRRTLEVAVGFRIVERKYVEFPVRLSSCQCFIYRAVRNQAHGQGCGRIRFCGERFECPGHVAAGSYEEPVGLFEPDAESGDDIFSIHCYRV